MLILSNIDIENIALDIKYTSPWNNGAGMLTFSYPSAKAGIAENGSEVVFTYDDRNIFWGWLFKSEVDKEKVRCTCYDQLRYFKSSDTLLHPVEPLDSFVNRVAYTQGDRIRLGVLDKTEINLSKYLFNNKAYLDMLYDSIKENLLLNGYQYTLRDNFGALELRDTFDLRLPLIIGDDSLATDYNYSLGIDSNTYNYIKVAKDDSSSGKINTYVAQDTVTIDKWGRLLYYDKVSANLSGVQLIERANRLIIIKNREKQALSIDCLGDTRVMGGNGIRVMISDIGLDAWFVVKNATHNFSKSKHTMNVELAFGGDD